MPDMPPKPDVVPFEDFYKLDLRIARIVEAIEHPNADRLFLLKIELGNEQRQLCAGLRGHYTAEQLVGKSIVVVANLAPRKVRGELSQGILLAASNEDHSRVILLTTEADIAPGSSVS